MRVLLLRFEAPLMSFGAVCVDSRGPTWDHPTLSQVTGLLANALGWDHADAEQLQRLQGRLRLASRVDRQGSRMSDYQSVDLGQAHLLSVKAGAKRIMSVRSERNLPVWSTKEDDYFPRGWTTQGHVEFRGGDEKNAAGTHERLRDYHADRIQTLALSLEPADEAPTIDDCAAALREPARPLFIGRKPCLPSRPIYFDCREESDLRSALDRCPRHRRADAGALPACWTDDGSPKARDERTLPIVDERDWSAQLHSGRRLLRLGRVNPPEHAHA